MLLEPLLLVLGVVLVWKGADLLVEGGSALAGRAGISPLVVGLTVVSFGTSAPELAVNVAAALEGSTGLALGNVLGSNLANVLLVLGVAAVLRNITVQRRTVWVEIPVAALAGVVLAILLNDETLVGHPSGLDRIDGLVLLVLFAVFLYYMYLMIRQNPHTTEETVATSVRGALLRTAVGAAGLALGAAWLVDGGLWLAGILRVPPSLVGLTVVAVGTSIPELATVVTAARRGLSDIAVGTVLGSNIFNIFLVLGVTAVIHPVPHPAGTNADLLAVVVSSIVLWILVRVPPREGLDRGEGIALLLLYAAYLVARVALGWGALR